MPENHEDGRVPCTVAVNMTVWEENPERLSRVKEECPHVAVHHMGDPASPRAKECFQEDAWGCTWHFPGMYLDGVVVKHPLDSWDKLSSWTPPPIEPAVEAIRQRMREAREANRPPPGANLEHGFLFLRLTYLRGFDNFMMDVAVQDPRLYALRDTVAEYWYQIAKAHLDGGADFVGGGDDLGLQDRLPISPDSWRDLIKPAYARIFGMARERGAKVGLHTDGYIVDIIPDLIETGVTTLNPQDLVNGLDNLARLAKGKVKIHLDIDRQNITVFGTPAEIDDHILHCIRTLGSPEGGLSLVWGVYPGTPVENIEAGMRAMEAHQDYWCR